MNHADAILTRLTTLTLLTLAFGAQGCLNLPDAWTSELPYHILDYRIDRPRVLGVRLSPPQALPGQRVEVDVLTLAPAHADPDEIVWEICGLRRDIPVSVRDVGCFRRDDAVEQLARAAPALAEIPDLSTVDAGRVCEPPWTEAGDVFGPCASVAPLRIMARFGSERAWGVISLPMPLGIPSEASFNLRHGVNTVELDVPAEAHAGERVTLSAFVPGAVEQMDLLGLRWFVDDGLLEGTSATLPQSANLAGLRTDNVLHIPEDYEGPLRVVLTVRGAAHDASWGYVADMAWDVATIEVLP